MNILEIIEKKRNKNELTSEEIKFFIEGYTNGEITDYQMSALIMAIYINGMTKQETTNLTLAMANSGEILDLSRLNKVIVDKHSTGGVGDKVSLILLPLVSACGVPVAKMSGRGLGFTGGTVDKLESIPGYNTSIDINKFVENVEKCGISMISQTLNLAPADKKIYALRDSISCVDSIPLIASSIMSKKIASGAEKIVLDVTVGNGAFMNTKEKATVLAEEMIEIGKLANRETICVLTNMDEPLGYAIGNILEIKEAVMALKGKIPEDVKNVVYEMGAYMLLLSGIAQDIDNAKIMLDKKINDGSAYNKFIELVENQGGDISYIKNIEKFSVAEFIEPIYSNKDGYIQEINAKEIGKLACDLGAGRIRKEDNIQKEVGIVLTKKVGDYVKNGDILAYIHTNRYETLEEDKKRLEQIIKIGDEEIEKSKIILNVIK
ncbi:MAG: thymidine phosphorylase [Clostridia bacterium]|nr:thymidine phosphorylase [Clostridia bacterium]